MASDCGVYKIETHDGRLYVGSASRGFGVRWRVHRHHLRAGTHHNKKLQCYVNKHGMDSLKFSVLIICAPEMAVTYEQIAMDALKPSMNAAPVAGSTLGYKHSEETKARFNERRRATTTQAGKNARRAGLANWVMSSEHKDAITKAKGRPVRCIYTGEIYASANKAAIALRASINPRAKGTNIAWAADGRLMTAYGYKWERT